MATVYDDVCADVNATARARRQSVVKHLGTSIFAAEGANGAPRTPHASSDDGAPNTRAPTAVAVEGARWRLGGRTPPNLQRRLHEVRAAVRLAAPVRVAARAAAIPHHDRQWTVVTSMSLVEHRSSKHHTAKTMS
jgi:hypothetical protein